MNKLKFYIYGVPEGFNMLSGTPDEILYYQLFYDTSKKGREMRINRKANGEIVYSYLIYNFVACKGRAGAFLGMSIAFTGNEYCNNPVALKELFEGVYNEVILKAEDKDKIIVGIDGGNAVGRFCITKFEERQEMCEKIGRIIINNITGELASYISTIDTSFDNSKEGRILTLPLDADNISINQALHSYTWVSLSSECKIDLVSQPSLNSPNPQITKPTPNTVNQDLLSVHFINELTKKVGNYKDFIIQGLKGLTSVPKVLAKKEEINHYLDTIEEYVGRQPELESLKKDYLSIYKELVGLKPQQPNDQTDNSQPNENGGIRALIQPYLSKIIAALCVLLIIIIVGKLWHPNEIEQPSPLPSPTETEISNKTDDASTEFNKNRFQNLLDNANYKEAWSMLQKVEDTEKQKSLKLELLNSYRNWFNNELKKENNGLQDLINLQEKIQNYNDFNYTEFRTVLKWHNNLLNEEINRLKMDSGNSNITISTEDSNIRIFEANDKYQKGQEISVQDNTITCKRKKYFVVEGENITFSNPNDIKNFECSKNNDKTIRIRTVSIGQYQVKFNSQTYIFNVTN